MANCYIDFICQQQDITRHDSNVVAEGTNVLEARFHLCPKWDGLTIYARFKHMAEVYDVLISDGCARVPREVIKYTGFDVSIWGEDAEGGVLTSESLFVDVKRSLSEEGAAPMPSTPSLIGTFIAKAAAAEAAALAAKETVNAIPTAAEAAVKEAEKHATAAAGSAAAAAEAVRTAAGSAAAAEQSVAAAGAEVNRIFNSTEEWELTMADGRTVRKVVCVK